MGFDLLVIMSRNSRRLVKSPVGQVLLLFVLWWLNISFSFFLCMTDIIFWYIMERVL